MPGGEDASPGHAGERVARSCIVCRTHGPARGPGQSRMRHRGRGGGAANGGPHRLSDSGHGVRVPCRP
eukprot:4045362-Prymnesium_polylepis.1